MNPGPGVGSTVTKGELSPADARILDAVFVQARRASSAQTIANNTDVAIAWDTETVDAIGAFDVGGANPARFTCPAGYAGKWAFIAVNEFTANGTGWRQLNGRKNGAGVIDGSYTFTPTADATFNTYQRTVFTVDLAATDYVEIIVRQTSGGNLDVVHNGSGIPTIQAVFLGA